MELEEIMRNARQTYSKFQSHTFNLHHEQVIDLYSVVERIATDLPVHTDCAQLKLTQRSCARVLIDGYMEEINQILSVGAEGPIRVYIALNFTWKKHFRHLSVGEMRLWMVHSDNEMPHQYRQPIQLFRCVSTRNKIRMDEILPEKDVVTLRRFAVSRPVLTSNIKPIFETTLALFENGNPKDLNKLASLLATKQNDTILYFSGSFCGKKEDTGDVFIIKLNVSDEKQSSHYSIRIPGNSPGILNTFEEKIFKVANDPIKKLRSYANRKELPFFESVYHVPENVLLFFNNAIQSSTWNNLGNIVLDAQEQWSKFPPYSGVFPIYFALCIEGNTFHIAVHSPKKYTSVETYVHVYDDELMGRKRRFFPDQKYVEDVRKHALDPSRELKPEDSFLEPYINAHRLSIISQKVRVPTDKFVPSKLASDVEKWRKHYRKKLLQHVSKHPRDAAHLKQILPSYADDIEDVAFKKAVKQYVYSTQQVPADHPFRQKIQQERRRVRQQAAKHTPDDLAQALLKDLNLIDPISNEPIYDPVRSPYNPTGIYQKQSLTSWLSRSGGLRLDPISSKVMPTTFKPKTDQQLKKFTQQLYPKIQQIMKKDDDDDVKKLRLLGLKQQLQQKQVFQNVIRSKSFQN